MESQKFRAFQMVEFAHSSSFKLAWQWVAFHFGLGHEFP